MSAEQLDALEAAIKERRKVLRQAATRLPRLEERRAALAAQLQEIESAIAAFTGEAPPERKATRKPTGKPATRTAGKPARSRKAAR